MAQQVINGTQQPFGLPNTGLGREEGDIWNLVVSKLNTMFSELYGTANISGQRNITGDLTLDDTYSGQTLYYAGSTDITITIPPALSPSFNCAMVQGGNGFITVAAGNGVTVNNPRGLLRTYGPYAIIGILGVALNTYILSGDVG